VLGGFIVKFTKPKFKIIFIKFDGQNK